MGVSLLDPQVVRADESYPLSDFAARVRLCPSGLRAAQRAGLRVSKVGRRKFVRGKDWLDFLSKRPDAACK